MIVALLLKLNSCPQVYDIAVAVQPAKGLSSYDGMNALDASFNLTYLHSKLLKMAEGQPAGPGGRPCSAV